MEPPYTSCVNGDEKRAAATIHDSSLEQARAAATRVLGALPRDASARRVRGTRPRAPPSSPFPCILPSPFPVHFVPSSSPVHIWTGRVLTQFISGKIIKQNESTPYKDGKGKLLPC